MRIVHCGCTGKTRRTNLTYVVGINEGDGCRAGGGEDLSFLPFFSSGLDGLR
jgi:hypothetical protein